MVGGPESKDSAFSPASTIARSSAGRLITVAHTKRLGSKAWGVVQSLGLAYLSHYGRVKLGLPPAGGLLYVTLHHAERPTRPLPAANGNEFSRTEEGFSLRIEAAPTGDAVALARLLGAHGRWRVDEAFRPARVGAHAR